MHDSGVQCDFSGTKVENIISVAEKPYTEWGMETHERIIVNAGRRNLCEVNYIPTSPHPTQMSFTQGLGTGISPLYSLAQFYHGAYIHMEEPVIHQESFMLQVQR